MNIKMLSIFSLLLTINVINCDDSDARKQYKNYYTLAIVASREVNGAMKKEKKKLYRTEKGRIYKANNNAWHKCTQNNDNPATLCGKLRTEVKSALEDLKETPEYTEFGRLLKLDAYYDNLKLGLRGILQIDASYPLDTWSKEKREERLNDAINDNTMGRYADADEYVLEWSEDVHEDEQRGQEKLRSIVKEVEANNQ